MEKTFLTGNYNQENELVDLYLKVALDGSGDPATPTKNLGITSISHTATGRYAITLNDAFNSLLYADFTFLKSTTDIGTRTILEAEDLDGTKILNVRFYNTAGALANPVTTTLMGKITAKISGESSQLNKFHNCYVAEREVISLFLDVALDGSSDPTTPTKQEGIASITHPSTGKYTITLRHAYKHLLWANALTEKAGSTVATRHQIDSEDVDGAKTLSIIFFNEAGTLTDPAASSSLRIQIDLQRAE